MENRELKPCPFCGGDAWYYTFDPYDGYQGNCVQHNIRCRKCSVIMVGTSEKIVYEHWNRRADNGKS
jgi:Lar family restriction alleviation protein